MAEAEGPLSAEDVEATLRPLDEATMLPARAYTDANVFAFERERLFGTDWVCVGRESDVGVAGTWFVAPVCRGGVIVVAGDDGVPRAFHNVCRHRGTTLLDGCGERAARIRCPYHGWSYDLRGRLALAPGMDDVVDFDPGAHGLAPVRLETFGGFLFVCLATTGPSLLAWLDDLPAQFEGIPLAGLVLGRRSRYTVRANWKLLMENFAESYHFGPVHPQLQRQTPSARAESLLSRGPSRRTGGATVAHCSANPGPRRAARSTTCSFPTSFSASSPTTCSRTTSRRCPTRRPASRSTSSSIPASIPASAARRARSPQRTSMTSGSSPTRRTSPSASASRWA
jgi:phenylpropionate dioxygenase-like ring-hydroxylating dioxygenase large terminal subunit